MFGDVTALELLKTLSILAIIAIPPWVILNRYIKHYLNKPVRTIIFIGYAAATMFTQTLMPFIAAVISLYFMRRSRNNTEVNYYLRPLEDKKLGILINSLVFKVIITVINLWFAYFLLSKGIKIEEQEIAKMLRNSGWIYVIILSVMTVIIAPILEEFIFRHILYRNLSKKMGKVASCILTSILFTLPHYNLVGSISFFGVGVYNCYLYDKYGYRAAVMNHFVFNFISTLFIILIKVYGIDLPA